MAITNLTAEERDTKTFDELACSPSLVGELQQQSTYFSAVNILFSITAFLGNSLILVALHKEHSLHPPSKFLYRCLATTDLLIGLVSQPHNATYWMSLVHEQWSLCRYLYDIAYITSYALCGASLTTMTAISVDRLLALLLGMRYRQIVTVKRIFITLAFLWVLCGIAALSYILDKRITFWCGCVVVTSCLVISIASYTKIFRALSHHRAQVQSHLRQQPSQANRLNMARYKKAVYSALWVQLALVVCYVPYSIIEIQITYSKTYSHLVVSRGIGVALVYFNSTLNSFLYCWKITEIRQAVKETIRQALCCS